MSKVLFFYCFAVLIGMVSYFNLQSQDLQQLSTNDTNIIKNPSLTFLNLTVDPLLSPQSSAESIITIQQAIGKGQDYLIGTKWFQEDGFWTGLGGKLLRLAKYIALEFPVDNWLIVVDHEYSGHGWVFRDAGIDNIKYKFDVPFPYGRGGGMTSFNLKDDNLNYFQYLTVAIGGNITESVLLDKYDMRWMSKGSIYYREALLYLFSKFNTLGYLQSTPEDDDINQGGHDYAMYVSALVNPPGPEYPEEKEKVIKDMKKYYLLNILDPFFIFSALSVSDYFGDGIRIGELLTLDIAGIKYLPALGMELTPFGFQYQIKNYVKHNESIYNLDIMVGDDTYYKSWGGAKININNIFYADNHSFDLKLSFWFQPDMEMKSDKTISKEILPGLLISSRVNQKLVFTETNISLFIELGYKTAGFEKGFSLESSPFILFGFSFLDK
ncbi:MAG: hypothetical protein V1779_00370 [bacterium]